MTLQHRQREDARVVVGQLALVLDLDQRRDAVVQALEHRAQPLGQREEGLHVLGGFAGGDVDGEGHEVAGQREHDLLGDHHAGLVLRLGRAGREVRRHDHPLEGEERRLGAGLLVEHIEGGAADPARADGAVERGLVDDPAPGAVDDAQPGLGLGQQLVADEPDALLGLQQVDRDEVGLADELVELDQLDAELAGPLRAGSHGSHTRMRMPKAWARWATSVPMRPRPMTPSVLP